MKIDHMLQVLICLALIYFLLSTLVSIIFEWYALKTKQRGKLLFKSIVDLLNDSVNRSYGASVYSHPQIERLKKDKDSPPQYISAAMFADALIDVIGQQSIEISYEHTTDSDGRLVVTPIEKRDSDPLVRFKKGVESMNFSPFREMMRSFHEKAGSYDNLKLAIGQWYDDYMERVSGWYKTRIQKTVFYFSLLVALVLNVDSFRLIRSLNNNEELRSALLKQADYVVSGKKDSAVLRKASAHHDTLLYLLSKFNLLKDSLDKKYAQRTDSMLRVINATGLPIGWNSSVAPLSIPRDISGSHYKFWAFTGYFLLWVLGILISSLALSFGAPFWFDVLKRLVNIRRAGGKPDKISLTQPDSK